jgi:putative DNA primase/helicase
LLIHHAGKSGQQRGTSRREDVLDTVITLKRPAEYKQQDGACFEVFFEKNRSLYGDEVKPFEAHLKSHLNEDGVKTFEWSWRSLEDSTFEKVCRLSCDGLSNTDITQELGIDKSTVSRHVKRGKQEGKINLPNN